MLAPTVRDQQSHGDSYLGFKTGADDGAALMTKTHPPEITNQHLRGRISASLGSIFFFRQDCFQNPGPLCAAAAAERIIAYSMAILAALNAMHTPGSRQKDSLSIVHCQSPASRPAANSDTAKLTSPRPGASKSFPRVDLPEPHFPPKQLPQVCNHFAHE